MWGCYDRQVDPAQRPHLPDGRRMLVRDQQVGGNSLRTLFLEAFVPQATFRSTGDLLGR